jgi:drug/metabolite transporter (DMT)-like permease
MVSPSSSNAGERMRGMLWALASALCSAGFMIPWQLATDHGEERHAVLVLLVSAALLNSAALIVLGARDRPPINATALRLSAALALLTLIGNEASAAAAARISGPLLSVLLRFEVVIVGLLAWLALGERMGGSFWLGAGIASAGVALTEGAAPTATHFFGGLLGLLAAMAFASMAVLTRRFILTMDPVRVNGVRLWLSVPLWIALHRELPQVNELSGPLVFHAGLAALFGPFLGRIFFMHALRHVPAAIAALCVLTAPAATLLLTWALLGEVPTASELSGGTVILAGIAIPMVATARRARRALP